MALWFTPEQLGDSFFDQVKNILPYVLTTWLYLDLPAPEAIKNPDVYYCFQIHPLFLENFKIYTTDF